MRHLQADDAGADANADAGAPFSFRFSTEMLAPERKRVAEYDGPGNASAAEVGSLLFQTTEGSTLDYVTNAREHGLKWFPELRFSVVNAFADTWACVPCCRCKPLGCTRPERICGINFYRISFTRAQWIWAFNVVCFVGHFVMFYLCMTSCNATRFGETINANCTAEKMEVPIFRTRSNCRFLDFEHCFRHDRHSPTC